MPTNGDSAQTALAVIEPPENWSREACDDWIAKFKGTAPGGRIGKALKPLVKRFGWDVIRAAWRKYLDGDDPQYITPETFASKLALWAAGGPKRGKGAQREERSREALMQWLRNEGAM